MQRDNNNARHQNRKGQISLNHKLVSQFEHWLKHDLPNTSNHIRVALSSVKKVFLKKKMADHIQDLISEHDNS